MQLRDRFISRLRRRAAAEDGFTMATAMLALLVVTLAMAATVTAVNGDIGLTGKDIDHKRAYEAAQAGLADYSFHLNSDNGYWSKCTNVPTPNAVNNNGSTAKRRNVPGNTGASYALELIPATGQSVCSTTNPVGSMIEQSGSSIGTFRLRSTGYSGDTEQSIVATFKRASFLDYVYFTQYETSDPVTYGSSSAIAQAYAQCEQFYREGRNLSTLPCREIVFTTGEQINGPLHTNDELNICGSPTFGRTPADLIEVSSPPTGYRASGGCSANPDFDGTYLTNSPVLTPPSTNDSLRDVQGAQIYTGQTRITLSGNNMTVTTNSGATSTIPIPASGVVYVANSTSSACSTAYSPFTATYPSNSSCGNVYVKSASGGYTGQLTIAAENDIIVDDDLCRGSCGSSTPSGTGLLGLIANNFIRVYHPLSNNSTTATNCNGSTNGSGSQTNMRIDAAMLSIQHSFIVDHYNCGSPLGTLTVHGAISQKFRGPVGTVSGTTTVSGYSKNYNYDDRLRYLAPPNFLDPVESAWHMQRQTLDP